MFWIEPAFRGLSPYKILLAMLVTCLYACLWLLIWIPIVISHMRPAVRRVLAGHVACRKCGYDLCATVDCCPECGTVPSQDARELIENPRRTE